MQRVLVLQHRALIIGQEQAQRTGIQSIVAIAAAMLTKSCCDLTLNGQDGIMVWLAKEAKGLVTTFDANVTRKKMRRERY